jgi:hypothetical protein
MVILPVTSPGIAEETKNVNKYSRPTGASLVEMTYFYAYFVTIEREEISKR